MSGELAALLALPALILGGAALFQTLRLRGDIMALHRQIARLDIAARRMPPEAPGIAMPDPPATPAVSTGAEEPPAAPPPLPAAPIAPMAEPVPIETQLTGRWTVWLGAVVLALGGIFLVKYSIDHELIGPAVRILLGLLLGTSLVAASLRLRARPLATQIYKSLPLDEQHVAAALGAAGLVTLFGTLYAAFALFAFIGPLFAFVLLAGVAAAAIGLSLLFGPPIALLGLAGAFIVPLLVPSDHPSAWGLFGYLLIVGVGCLAVTRYQGWWWLAAAALGCAALWVLAWLLGSWHRGDALAIGLYLVGLAAATIGIARDAGAAHEAGWRRLTWSTAATIAAEMTLLDVVALDSAPAIVASFAIALIFLGAAWRRAAPEPIGWIVLTMAAAIAAAWRLDNGILYRFGPSPMVPEQVNAFLWTLALFAALFGTVGFVVKWTAPRPAIWAAQAAAAPVALLVIAYARLVDEAPGALWAVAALALAGLCLAAARHAAAFRHRPGMETALAAYAVGVVAATTLALTMTLHYGWLSVGLALQLPALTWIEERTEVAVLRPVGLAVAVAVLCRLLLNPSVFDYPLGEGLLFNWLLYGYGLPCLTFIAAAWRFRRRAEDRLVAALEGGAIALALALVSLELHHAFAGGALSSRQYGFVEASLQTNAWLLGGLGLFRWRGRHPHLVADWAWRIVGTAGALHLVLYQLVVGNPLVSGTPVGDTPVLNRLLLAYAVPAVIAALFGREAARQGESRFALAGEVTAIGLGFVTVTLEIRQLFHGAILSREALGDAEGYCYSLAWLIYGAALLGLGIIRKRATLRLAALMILTLTVAKAFLFDMSNLTGLYRAGSFLALGLCLIGIGWLYQLLGARAKPPGNLASRPS